MVRALIASPPVPLIGVGGDIRRRKLVIALVIPLRRNLWESRRKRVRDRRLLAHAARATVPSKGTSRNYGFPTMVRPLVAHPPVFLVGASDNFRRCKRVIAFVIPLPPNLGVSRRKRVRDGHPPTSATRATRANHGATRNDGFPAVVRPFVTYPPVLLAGTGDNIRRRKRVIAFVVPLRRNLRESRSKRIRDRRLLTGAARATAASTGAANDYSFPGMVRPFVALPPDLLVSAGDNVRRRERTVPFVIPLRRNGGEVGPVAICREELFGPCRERLA